MNKEITLGLIGCDTSDSLAFTRILNDPAHEHPVAGARITTAFSRKSSEFGLSQSRMSSLVKELREKWGVAMVDTPEEVAAICDGILITSSDGRIHRDQFERIAPSGKPTFIDAPFALDAGTAREIFRLADAHELPLMSCSALRYAERLVELLNDTTEGSLFGADFYGPMPLQPPQPGLFGYGIHTIEMLFAAFGKGCAEVRASHNEDHELVTALWQDGRIGTVRGNRRGNDRFGGVIHRERGSHFVDIQSAHRSYHASLLDQVLAMLTTGVPPIDHEETVEIIRFIEASNESRRSGEQVPV